MSAAVTIEEFYLRMSWARGLLPQELKFAAAYSGSSPMPKANLVTLSDSSWMPDS